MHRLLTRSQSERLIAFTLLFACVSPQEQSSQLAARLDADSLRQLIPQKVADKDGWARDIMGALDAVPVPATLESVCSVIAIVEQESGFQADPQIQGLPRIVREGLKEKLGALGPLSDAALAALLTGRVPGDKLNFEQRVERLKSEHDLDLLFRDIAAAYRSRLPGTFIVASALSLALGKGSLYDLNPVTTAGSMQVKIAFAREIKGVAPRDDGPLREEIYTRAGGMRYGAARLLGYKASYKDPLFRFADYNAGPYASRNAAFQKRLSELGGTKLILDGDLLAYDRGGEPSARDANTLRALLSLGAQHGLSEWRIRHDAEKEKSEDFESSDTWRLINTAWEKKTGRIFEYARLPDVVISSPKLRKSRSTAWFAQSVKKRYDICQIRYRPK